LQAVLQTLVLTVVLVIGLGILMIPASLMLTVFSLISPAVAQIVLLVATFFSLWWLLPLVFSPHGIFAFGQNAITSLITSNRLVRKYMPGTGMFLVILIVLSEGLDVVWRFAPPESWMMLIGIAGHAFVTTALVAASFIYYQGGMRWMQENLRPKAAASPSA
jgi:hypothetical protein